MSSQQKIVEQILDELKRAKKKFPTWPTDPVHCAAVIGEEAGEVIQAALDFFYGRAASRARMREEALQVGAMAIRFLEGLENKRCRRKIARNRTGTAGRE
jgi:NTP pyrophosphatase (non-canonical NTP hydrolase)